MSTASDPDTVYVTKANGAGTTLHSRRDCVTITRPDVQTVMEKDPDVYPPGYAHRCARCWDHTPDDVGGESA
ncbi:hypothetical protein [Halobaculum sp. D14]|uniref:hypothetical protein n=1 Tax=Halobaculum sp. D14 TaxID=3421642 RepID=UPI003EB9232B